jgi:hypothetical protein
MRIKKTAAVATMAVGLMGFGTAAQALLVDADSELGWLTTILAGVDDAVDRETDELVTDGGSPVRDLATDSDSIVGTLLNEEGSLLDEIQTGLLSGGDALLTEDVEDILCIVLEGDVSPDCEDAGPNSDLLDNLLGGILDLDGDVLGLGGLDAVVAIGAFVGLF